MKMKILFFLCALLFFSCGTKKGGRLPHKEKSDADIEKLFSFDSETFAIEERKFRKGDLEEEVEIDTSAQIDIISQIPFNCLNLFDSTDICELKIRQNLPKSLLVEVPQSLFFNSIQTANEISDFAKNSPASVRGIFGDLLGVSELASGTQKVIFGIIPKTARAVEFRFESPITNTGQILNHLIWKYNLRFETSISQDNILVKRKVEFDDGSKSISYRFVENGDFVIELGGNEKMTMLLFKKSDLGYVRTRLQDFNITEFDRLTVSAFFNPSLDFEVKNALFSLLKNTEIYKNMDYVLRTFDDEKQENNLSDLGKDSIVIIYDKDNPIAFETAIILNEKLKNAGIKTIMFADLRERKQYFLDYDLAIGVNSADFSTTFLARKYLGKDFSVSEIDDLRLKTDLFEMKIFLCSPQKIVGRKNILSKLEVEK
jgi:hypothetical protein